MANKRVKENLDYVKTESGAVVLDSKNKYNEFIQGRNRKLAEKQEVIDLRSEVDELKKLVNTLIKGKK